MAIYDKLGNMKSDRAAEVACDMAQQAEELFETLFAEGMTVLEARALLGYIKSQLDVPVIMAILRRQAGIDGSCCHG